MSPDHTVLAHGASRFTKDIDLLVDDAPENVVRVKQGLAILADNAAADIADHDVRDHVLVRVIDEVIVDLMGLWPVLRGRRLGHGMAHMSGVRVPIASPATLVRTKDTYRPQDAIDRSFLQQLIERRRSQ
jgi:hypothetical protein